MAKAIDRLPYSHAFFRRGPALDCNYQTRAGRLGACPLQRRRQLDGRPLWVVAACGGVDRASRGTRSSEGDPRAAALLWIGKVRRGEAEVRREGKTKHAARTK